MKKNPLTDRIWETEEDEAGTRAASARPFKVPLSRLQRAEFEHESGGEGAVKMDLKGCTKRRRLTRTRLLPSKEKKKKKF